MQYLGSLDLQPTPVGSPYNILFSSNPNYFYVVGNNKKGISSSYPNLTWNSVNWFDSNNTRMRKMDKNKAHTR